MNQKSDYNSLKPKWKRSSFGIGLLSMVICLGTQMALASPETNLSTVEMSNTVQSTVTGTVTDADGQPLPGANVLVKGTTTGTQTDFDGNYTIEAAGDATLVFSYIGFATQEVAVGGQSTVNASMAEDASQLEEVVVLGYSTQTRGDLTGSVASVDLVEATKAPIVNAAEALQGRVSGVTVVQNANPGSPPKINIRGFGSSNNTNPLFIIDGLQTDDPFVLNSINPNDISQMNVLKDGAAAIYGARASNGVVIITTKGGGYNMDKPIVSIDTYTGFSEVNNLPELLNAQQLGDVLFQSSANDGTAFDHPQYGNGATATVPSSLNGYTRVVSYNPIVRGPASAAITPGGTDWLDAITRSAAIQSVSLSVANGEENSKYSLSTNYINQQGILLETGFKQGQVRLNSEFKLGDKVRIGEHFSAAYSNSKGGGGAQIEGAMRSSPLIPLYDDEGRFAGTGAQGTGNARSPLAQLNRGADDFNKTIRLLGDVYLTAEIANGLTFKTSIGGTINSFNTRRFQALDAEHGEPLGTNTLFETNQDGYSWVFSNTLNYKKTFGDHKIDALAGIESVKEGFKGKAISRNGYLFETPDFYLLNNGSGTPNVDFAADTANSLFSVFGSATYSFADKYFLTGTLRNDTSSRFLGDNKSDIFPSVSAGWVLSKEDFIASSDGIVSFLKLKGSWGQLGNQTLPSNNPTINISSLSEGLANYSLNGSTIATGAILSSVGNPNLKWETTVAINAGIELGLFDNKLNFDFEWYTNETKDLISRDNSLISTTAIDAGAPLVNLGSFVNTGFDANLRFKEETTSGIRYGFDLNFSTYDNEVTELISEFQLGNSGFRGGAVTRTEVGRPVSSFYGRQVTGFDSAGRFTYLDVTGDGTIDDNDRTFLGSPHADFSYGINLNVGYKGFDISAFLQGSQGNDIYNYTKIFTDFPTFVNGNRSVRVLDSWTPSNTDATLPALSNSIQNSETQPNSYFVEDGSYLRLRNLQIGYALPDSVVEKIGLDSFRIYVQGTNLLTITGYDGFDPEVISNDNLTLGVDNQITPQAKIYTVGLNIKL